MTTPAYLDDSTVREFRATVQTVDRPDDGGDDGGGDDRYEVVLDRTHFYPTGGGQPHDTGQLRRDDGTWPVRDVVKRGTIRHVVEGTELDGRLRAGDAVVGELDWDRRWAHMRYHTAQHVLSAVLLDEFDSPTAGNQLYADRARLDCRRDDRFTRADLEDVEALVNAIVDDDRPVTWSTYDREEAERRLDPARTRLDLLPSSVEAVRVVEIEGLDRTACAGTHVASTGRIGRFVIDGRETGGSGRERIRFRLAD